MIIDSIIAAAVMMIVSLIIRSPADFSVDISPMAMIPESTDRNMIGPDIAEIMPMIVLKRGVAEAESMVLNGRDGKNSVSRISTALMITAAIIPFIPDFFFVSTGIVTKFLAFLKI